MKVNILLSTYNGEKYLSKQIDSIINQTFSNWNLLIRDDGSKDKTPQIIKEYCSKDERIHFINESNISNVGVHRSFKELAAFEEADYYFLSDQDDVWKKKKIEKMLQVAHGKSNSRWSGPKLYYSDLTIVNSKLEVISERIKNPEGNHKAPILKDFLANNVVTGCSAMFNLTLRNLWLADSEIIALHDSMLGILAAAFGQLIFIDEPLIYYRQHEANVVGAKTKGSAFQVFWNYHAAMQKRAENVLKEFSTLSPESRKILVAFRKLETGNIFSRLAIVVKYRYRYAMGDWKYTLAYNLLMLTKFRKN
ncbi:glycosyltransferase family 2 protein [Lactococcus taiwanensis]|uniref:glycosyltransferase family 2 protein n=1 Tax=Lactococcus taiwanensis TaxID=1151742 RepID=UPI003D11777C